MTVAPTQTTTWHTNVTFNGRSYPTRNHTPLTTINTYDLPARQEKYVDAIHEAGHAIAILTGGGHLHSATIRAIPNKPNAGGLTDGCNLVDENGHTFAAFSGAGERAIDRWLREEGLWTPERAVAAEIGARGDRRSFLNLNPHVGYGDRDVDYRVVHDLADTALDQHWPAVVRVADALAQHGHLTGDTIADLADLPNGTHTAH